MKFLFQFIQGILSSHHNKTLPMYLHPDNTPLSNENLSLGAPHTLKQAIPLCKPVQRIIALATRTNKPTESINLVFASVTAVLVNLANRDLHGGVVVGFNDAVSSAAFAGDVEIDNFSFLVLHFDGFEIVAV